MLRRIKLANVLPVNVIHVVLKIYREDEKFCKKVFEKEQESNNSSSDQTLTKSNERYFFQESSKVKNHQLYCWGSNTSHSVKTAKDVK